MHGAVLTKAMHIMLLASTYYRTITIATPTIVVLATSTIHPVVPHIHYMGQVDLLLGPPTWYWSIDPYSAGLTL